MRDFHRNMLALVAAPALFTAPLAAQQVRTLPAPDATFEEPFSNVSGLRELSNGRVIVADARDKVLQLIDLASQEATKIGREGSGPGEFGMPMRLFPAPRDTSYLFDPLNQRYLAIAPEGKAVGQFMLEAAPPPPVAADAPASRQVGTPQGARQGAAPQGGRGSQFGGAGLRIGFPEGADAQGRIYMATPGFSTDANGVPVSPDSAPITRWTRATKKTDTLTWVRLAKSSVQTSGSQGNMRVMVGGANPLAIRDAWAVFPDGRVAVLRGAEYRIDFVMPNGSIVRGQPIKYSPIKFTEADRKEEEAQRNRARQGSMMITMNTGASGTQRSAQMGPGANAPPLEPLTDWPEVKPPFRPGNGALWARPNGELWVRRMEPAGAKGTLYDVINAQGAVAHQVRVQHGINVVGMGNGTIYTTKADEDDLLYLQRHRGI
jgi:hypothetical protein